MPLAPTNDECAKLKAVVSRSPTANSKSEDKLQRYANQLQEDQGPPCPAPPGAPPAPPQPSSPRFPSREACPPTSSPPLAHSPPSPPPPQLSTPPPIMLPLFLPSPPRTSKTGPSSPSQEGRAQRYYIWPVWCNLAPFFRNLAPFFGSDTEERVKQ